MKNDIIPVLKVNYKNKQRPYTISLDKEEQEYYLSYGKINFDNHKNIKKTTKRLLKLIDDEKIIKIVSANSKEKNKKEFFNYLIKLDFLIQNVKNIQDKFYINPIEMFIPFLMRNNEILLKKANENNENKVKKYYIEELFYITPPKNNKTLISGYDNKINKLLNVVSNDNIFNIIMILYFKKKYDFKKLENELLNYRNKVVNTHKKDKQGVLNKKALRIIKNLEKMFYIPLELSTEEYKKLLNIKNYKDNFLIIDKVINEIKQKVENYANNIFKNLDVKTKKELINKYVEDYFYDLNENQKILMQYNQTEKKESIELN